MSVVLSYSISLGRSFSSFFLSVCRSLFLSLGMSVVRYFFQLSLFMYVLSQFVMYFLSSLFSSPVRSFVRSFAIYLYVLIYGFISFVMSFVLSLCISSGCSFFRFVVFNSFSCFVRYVVLQFVSSFVRQLLFPYVLKQVLCPIFISVFSIDLFSSLCIYVCMSVVRDSLLLYVVQSSRYVCISSLVLPLFLSLVWYVLSSCVRSLLIAVRSVISLVCSFGLSFFSLVSCILVYRMFRSFQLVQFGQLRCGVFLSLYSSFVIYVGVS